MFLPVCLVLGTLFLDGSLGFGKKGGEARIFDVVSMGIAGSIVGLLGHWVPLGSEVCTLAQKCPHDRVFI